MKPKLSYTQQHAIRELQRAPDGRYGWGSSCINPTMSALERQGLVKVEFDRTKGTTGFPWSRWVLTPMGEDYLNGVFK